QACVAAASLAFLIVFIASFAEPYTAKSPFVGASEVSMYILAVGESGGRYFGVPTRLDVIVTNGTGVVYLSTEPLAQVDMQASARLAALIASYIVGKDFYKYDFFISVKSNSTIIGGPSAGAAMTVAIVAAFLHVKPNESVVETGMIMPDGTIGPVGGIPEKLQAAEDVHAKVMLIPAGQRIAFSLSRGRYVDVVQLGKKIGVKVVEVSTIYDALNWFGINITRPPKGEVSIGGRALEVIKSWIRESNQTYLKYSSEAGSLLLKLQEGNGLVSTYLKSAEFLASRASVDIKEGNYYSAASDLFGAVINATTAYWLGAIISGEKTYKDLLTSVSSEVREALAQYEKVRADALSSGDILKISLAVEVASRAMEANKSLSQLPSTPSSPGDVFDAVYTYYRARTVMDWSKMYYALEPCGIEVSAQRLEKYVALLVYFSSTTASYIQSLIGGVGAVTQVDELVEQATALEGRDVIASLATALKASATAAAILNTAFTTDIKGTALRLKAAALEGIGEAVAERFNPVVAMSYVERGNTLMGVDYGSAVYFYDLALINTMWYMIISGARVGKVVIHQSTATQPNAGGSGTPSPVGTEKTPTQTTGGGSGLPGFGNESTPSTPENPAVVPSTNLEIDAAVIVGAIAAGFLLGLATRRKPKG
ncbi:MAG: hypothetical protein J7L55_02440, partial [Desulfurococcales archaeon]|nr:hypothetical protein [Desulfurococcales archaeon]